MDDDSYNPHDLARLAQKMGIERAAIGHANYPGDIRHSFDLETFDGGKGPSYMGEILFPVDAVYDEETNTTKVGFSLMPPPPQAETEEDDG